jgi:hypothetical protein
MTPILWILIGIVATAVLLIAAAADRENAYEQGFSARADEVRSLESRLRIARDGLQKIANPRKYHHWESDPYTRAGCFQHVADGTLETLEALEAQDAAAKAT